MVDYRSMGYEIMAPAGSWDSLSAAVKAGADSVYFGVESLNMRAHSAHPFTVADLPRIVERCRLAGVKSYLTVNTIIYPEDFALMHSILDAAKAAGVSAVIASDVAVLVYCRRIGLEVHLSTQLNISNAEALRFYAQYADVAVLARELNLDQVSRIHHTIIEDNITGPSGKPVRIEMFCHGALCMAISGKCYLSLNNLNSSANRGACLQVCRRAYTVRDRETGVELDVDNKYIMSPKDLKTIRFLDRMVEAGVKVFKIEGRARGPEYVLTTVQCYKEALTLALTNLADKTAGRAPKYTPEQTEAKKDEWDKRLATVFNRGFWDGYYLGQRLGEWNKDYGSSATEKKVYVGRGVKYFSRIGVGEFYIEAATLDVGDKLLITGPTTGALYLDCTEIRYDLHPVSRALQGQSVSIPVPEKIRPSDKLFKIVAAQKTPVINPQADLA